MNMLLVALGGALGAVLRFVVGEQALRFGISAPLATLAINVAGSFLLGWLAASGMERRAFLLLGVGVLGGFTTFSTFSVQTLSLLERAPLWALAYVAGSVLMSLLAAWCGLLLGRAGA